MRGWYRPHVFRTNGRWAVMHCGACDELVRMAVEYARRLTELER